MTGYLLLPEAERDLDEIIERIGREGGRNRAALTPLLSWRSAG